MYTSALFYISFPILYPQLTYHSILHNFWIVKTLLYRPTQRIDQISNHGRLYLRNTVKGVTCFMKAVQNVLFIAAFNTKALGAGLGPRMFRGPQKLEKIGTVSNYLYK